MDIYGALQNYTTENRSELSKDFFLLGDVRTIGLCVCAYLYMCLYGPRLMQSRKEMQVKPVMQAYNIFMIVSNAYILEEIVATIEGCNWLCEPGDFRVTPRNTRHARALWLYYLTKIIEFLDTAFFIVRKKFTHVSFLHCYHHASMSVLMWIIVTFMPTGDAFAPVLFNVVIHVIMYSYYFFAALGPEFQKYLWWKKHLTKLQIIQFFLIIHHGISALWMNCNPRHRFIYYFLVCYMVSFVILFLQFYIRSYIRTSSSTSTTKTNKSKATNNNESSLYESMNGVTNKADNDKKQE
ncbi:very long chain fatty acid elongase AAEL008004-like [Convolutriloba macropyga]|uniref:very long chain fatty acid elongase AAEL008004-like n=1 Tax=Convolutriloba macropyga TaxID=536237 RepID=UPI003F52628D